MSYRTTLAEHIRICVLRLLAEAIDYEANTSILADSVATFGLKCSRDFLAVQLTWLDEQGLVTLSTLTPTLSVARLTSRGHDVAKGHAHVPGVKRPSPEG